MKASTSDDDSMDGRDAGGRDPGAEGVAVSALERSRAQLRGMFADEQAPLPESDEFPRSRLMRAALGSRYRSLWLAGGAAAVLLVGRRMPIARIAALLNGYRMARRLWPARRR